jgi:hypothetical protein
MLEVQSKNTEHLVTIATHLETLVVSQDKIMSRLYNGMGKDISDKVLNSVDRSFADVKGVHAEQTKTLTSIDSNITKVVWLVGSVALVVAVALAVTQFTHWVSHNKPAIVQEAK